MSVPTKRQAWKVVAYVKEKLDVNETFKLVEEDIPELRENQILVQVEHLSVEPTMRNNSEQCLAFKMKKEED